VTRLLIVHHTPSPHLHTLLSAVREGAGAPGVEGVEVRVRAALSATASDVLASDAVIVGGPVNLGYLAGAVKHFFDTVYYPCLEDTVGLPFGAYLHGTEDLAGAFRALEVITTGLRWRRIAEVVEVRGAPRAEDRDAAWELGAVVAATIAP
jgi:multimeric flavodoxin WrbA